MELNDGMVMRPEGVMDANLQHDASWGDRDPHSTSAPKSSEESMIGRGAVAMVGTRGLTFWTNLASLSLLSIGGRAILLS
jgi:hypothetical protein